MWSSNAVLSGPAQSVFGSRPRPIFSANPALIAKLVHRLEHRGVVDLAFVGLAARRDCRALQMPDGGQEFLETVDQISANDLNVIEIELHSNVWFPNFADNVGCMLDM